MYPAGQTDAINCVYSPPAKVRCVGFLPCGISQVKYPCANLKNHSSAISGNRQMRSRADDTNVEDIGDLLTKRCCWHPIRVLSQALAVNLRFRELNYGREKITKSGTQPWQ